MAVRDYQPADEFFISLAKKLKVSYYLEPVNEKEEKREFLASRQGNPEFFYRDLEYDPKRAEQSLNSLEIPAGKFEKIFRRKKRSFLQANEIIKNRGHGKIVRKITIRRHGVPSESLMNWANKLLRETPGVEAKKVVSSEIVKKALEDSLNGYGLTDWSVEFSDKKLTSVYSSEKKVTIFRERKFSKTDTARLVVHEIGVHVLRAANGYQQSLKIFAVGLAGYLSTEEGLALYAEELAGMMSKEKIRDYAARVIAVDSVCQKLNFRETFNRLKKYDLTDNQAWSLSVRAHRGGGYVKDHLYLDGFKKIKDFAQKDGDFKTLYVGKVGTKDLPLVRELLKKGIIKKAKYIPRLFQ